jgi:hypothetical protein
MKNPNLTNGVFRTYLLIGAMAILILGKGFLAFSVIGDLGMPAWDYRPVKDVPGESPYAVYPTLPYPQHIRGAKGE